MLKENIQLQPQTEDKEEVNDFGLAVKKLQQKTNEKIEKYLAGLNNYKKPLKLSEAGEIYHKIIGPRFHQFIKNRQPAKTGEGQNLALLFLNSGKYIKEFNLSQKGIKPYLEKIFANWLKASILDKIRLPLTNSKLNKQENEMSLKEYARFCNAVLQSNRYRNLNYAGELDKRSSQPHFVYQNSLDEEAADFFKQITKDIVELKLFREPEFRQFKRELDVKNLIDNYLNFFLKDNSWQGYFEWQAKSDYHDRLIALANIMAGLRQGKIKVDSPEFAIIKDIAENYKNLDDYIEKKYKDFILPAYYHIFSLDSAYSTEKIIEILSNNRLEEEKSKQLVILLTDLIGAEKARQKLNELIEQYRQQNNQTAVDNLEYIRSFITPNHDKIAIENLRRFYQENIKFEEYEVNKKMNTKELELLSELIGKNEKILEMGFGTGRLLLEMKKRGYDVVGYDLVERHIEYVKNKDKETKVFQGDWHQTALKNESFNAVYSLGRNILHDYSLPDQIQLFRETYRLLKPGGKFIFDVPDRQKGGYKIMIEEYAQEMKRRGIRNFRYGAIYDSPDGKHFATRYVYSQSDIKELARLVGFEIEKVKRKALETGQGDENLYYILKK